MSASLVDKITNKLDFSKRNGIAVTGNPADEIIVHGASGVNKIVKEEKEKRAVFTFGRFNPPTTGHQKLIDAVKSAAQKQGGEHHIFASHTQDKTKNPLGFDEKVGFMKKMYPKTNINSSHTVRNVLDAAKSLQARGVTHGTLVVGSDRVDEFHNLLSKYNKHPSDPAYDPKKHFHIPHLSVVSAGQRDPDAEGVEGMSASKMRGHATAGNFKEFSKGVPNQTHAKPMYDVVRNRMGIKEELTLEQMIRGKLDSSASNFQQQLDMKKKKTIQASRKEDQHGRSISKKVSYNPKPTAGLNVDLTSQPYEETIPTPFQRDELAPGNKPVDIGMDKDLEPKDTNKQLKRRKTMKLFKAYVEGMDGESVTGSEKPGTPAPITTALPSVKLPKQRIKTMNSAPVSEDSDDNEMAKNQLDTVIRGAKELKSKIKNKKDLPAWVQSKITKGEDQIDTVADYMKSEEKRGLWDNIHAKRKRIKAGSGERMRKPGSEGAPSAADLKASQTTEESHTNCGTPECCGECDKGYIEERGADSKGFFRPTEKGAGLTPKGAKHFGIQTAVTGKVKPGSKAAGRRKSFCARMGGMPGPMKDEKGRPTRKAMSLRRWRCRT